VGEAITPEEKQRLEDTAAYLVRNALSLKKLVYLDGEKAVLDRSRMNPFLGRDCERSGSDPKASRLQPAPSACTLVRSGSGSVTHYRSSARLPALTTPASAAYSARELVDDPRS
jgi:hypothetical protein